MMGKLNNEANPQKRTPAQELFFVQLPASLVTHESEPLLTIKVSGPKSNVTFSVLSLTAFPSLPLAGVRKMFLTSVRSKHTRYIRAFDLSEDLPYARMLLRLLRVTCNHPDALHLAGLRPGHWTRIRVTHPIHFGDAMPGFKFSIRRRKKHLKTRMRRTDTDDCQTLPFPLSSLIEPLGDMMAGILREHYTTQDLPECPVDWRLI